MTRNELLNRIKEGQWVDRQEMILRSNALRAVVELHQQRDDNSCQHCVTWYPCLTIQAIEKELS